MQEALLEKAFEKQAKASKKHWKGRGRDAKSREKHTKSKEKTSKKQCKWFTKVSKNGRLSKELFYEMYQKLCPNDKNAKGFCNHVFRAVDADNNGYISFREFLLALDITIVGTPEDKLKWAFRLYDINGDGVVNRCEMIIIIESMFKMFDPYSRGKNYANNRAKKIFTQLDINNDLKLTEDEFVLGCLQDEELTRLLTSGAFAVCRKLGEGVSSRRASW